MCVPPKIEQPATPASLAPSLPSAQALELGGATGVPRGAALLGRLKLRTGGNTRTPAPAGKSVMNDLALPTAGGVGGAYTNNQSGVTPSFAPRDVNPRLNLPL